MKKFVITIGREYGSGGRIIGEKLAKRLGVNFYDKNMIDKNEKIEVAICPIQDIIKVFPYSNKDFKCIERYFKYNFNFLPPIHLVLLILKVAYSSFSFLK